MSIETKFNIGDKVYLVFAGKNKTTKIPECPHCGNTRKIETFEGVQKDRSVGSCKKCRPHSYSSLKILGDKQYTIYGISVILWADDGLQTTYYLEGSSEAFPENRLFLNKKKAEDMIQEYEMKARENIIEKCLAQEVENGVSYNGVYFFD